MSHERSEPSLPKCSPWVRRFFTRYTGRLLGRHFHALRLAVTGDLPAADAPLIVYLNHPSWWDPLIALQVAEAVFPGRPLHAPMDAAALEKYSILAKLGMFPVEAGTRRGARRFLTSARQAVQTPGGMLWLTPQGRFADVRERPLRFAPGLAALCRLLPEATLLPLAIEYTHWTERLPEALARLGPAQRAADLVRDSTRVPIQSALESALASTMDALAADAVQRKAEAFRQVLGGKAGSTLPYDLWRWLRSWWRREPFSLEHEPAGRRIEAQIK